VGLKAYIQDIVEAVVTTAKGMRITARYGVSPGEEITQQYPEERRESPERFRGFLYNDVARCTACTLCVKACPIDAIAMESVRGADKKLVLVSYDINIGRCMFCGLCVEACPPKSLRHDDGYERASVDRGEFILHFVHEPAEAVKARVAQQVAEAQAKEAAAKAAEAAAPGEGTGAPAPAAKAADKPGRDPAAAKAEPENKP
jgi:NADH-quinone oxidoreductase subunit I